VGKMLLARMGPIRERAPFLRMRRALVRSGERGMSLDSVDRLMECLDLEIKPRRKRKDG
jgi:hypothetical protein